jgi:hypothetical protein
MADARLDTLDSMVVAVRRRPELVHYQHFEVAPELLTFCQQAFEDDYQNAVAEVGDADIPPDYPLPPNYGRLPAQKMTLTFVEPTTDEVVTLFLVEEGPEHRVRVGLIADGDFAHSPLPVGEMYPGHILAVDDRWNNVATGDNPIWDVSEWLPYLLALINEPRIVELSPSASRQRRRAAERGFGFAVDAWTRITWDLSKATKAKVARDPSFHCVPLHYVRGHFRRAEPHFRGAIQRPHALRIEDRVLWWQFIEGHWKGHPAFGVRRSVHAPIMSGALARRRSAARGIMTPHPASAVIEEGPDGPDVAPVGWAVGSRGQGAVVSDPWLTGRFGPDGPDGPNIAGFPVCARGDGG